MGYYPEPYHIRGGAGGSVEVIICIVSRSRLKKKKICNSFHNYRIQAKVASEKINKNTFIHMYIFFLNIFKLSSIFIFKPLCLKNWCILWGQAPTRIWNRNLDLFTISGRETKVQCFSNKRIPTTCSLNDRDGQPAHTFQSPCKTHRHSIYSYVRAL